MVKNTFFVSLLLIHIMIQTENLLNLPHNVSKWRYTAITYLNISRSKLNVLPSWFRMKLRMFHIIMFSTYIASLVQDTFTQYSRLQLFYITSYLGSTLDVPIYWGTIVMSCTGLLYVEAVVIFTYKPPTLSQREYDGGRTINLMFTTQQHHHPLPKRYCVLSNVALLPTFTGWLIKLGKTFGGFISSMHRIGTNAIMYKEAQCKASRHKVNLEIKTGLSSAAQTIFTMKKLLMLLILFNCGWYIDAVKTKDTMVDRVTNEHKQEDPWMFSQQHAMEYPDDDPKFDFADTNLITDNNEAVCCISTHDEMIAPVALHNSNTELKASDNASFSCDATEFATDNCATHHICSQLSLFTSMRPAPTIGVQGVSGRTMASGIGTIEFILTDEENIKHKITIEDVIYLPESPKNLISIAKWDIEKNDNCGILSRGTYSVFMWNKDKHRKHIPHSPSCPIPIMPVNENDEAFVLFNDAHSKHFPDNGIILPEGAPQPMEECMISRTGGDTALDQQSKMVLSTSSRYIKTGSTVWHTNGNKRQIAIVTKQETNELENKYTIRPLNSTTSYEVAAKDIVEIRPSPADIPTSPAEVDTEVMTECLTKEDLETLWSGNIDNTMNKNERLSLYWHHRLRHAPLKYLHRLATRGVLPKAILLVRKLPLCAACAFATAHRRGWRTKSKSNRPIRKPNHDSPGKGTSCDHVVSHQPGLIPQSTGILSHTKFWGSVMFVDHYSDFVFNHLITGTTSQATFEAKQAYEREAASFDVKIKSYHADNLRFNDRNFQGDCIKNKQTISFCGVGAHHQNAIAESKVKSICYGARTILLHAKRKWPKVIATALWPFAMQAIVRRHNHLALDENGSSPIEKFSGIKDNIDPTDFHTWGCPVYILNEANQGAIGTPKWEPRSHLGIYLGHSPQHAGSVALVLNLRTGHVSPQFHVIYDDEFSTIPYLSGNETPPNWSQLWERSIERSVDPNNIKSTSWLHPQGTPIDETTASEGDNPTIESTIDTPASEGDATNMPASLPLAHSPPAVQNNTVSQEDESVPTQRNAREDAALTNNFVDIETLGLRRSTRTRKQPDRMSAIDPNSREIPIANRPLGFLILAASAFISRGIGDTANNISHCYQSRVIEYEDYLDNNFDGTRNSTNPLAQIYMTSKANNEVYTLKEMLKQPDRMEFLKAMKEEVQSLFDEQIWKLVPRDEMTQYYDSQRSEGKTIQREQIMMIWSFKRKRHPDGSFNKCKARLCCHGGQQQYGVNYWDTYAPVVSWSSVRILLTLAKLHNFHTTSIDFVQAYPQADVKNPIFLKVPAGVVLNDNNGKLVLRLMKNLYGLKDAGKTWFEHLTDGLTGMGFMSTSSDPCIFIKGSNIIILYVDDCVIMSRTKKGADDIYNELERRKYKLTKEGSMEEYLGIQIDHHKDDSFRMSQPFLVKRIIEFIPGMSESNGANSPACSSVVLTKDDNGEPRKETWNYRAIVGMLNYLVNCTHPELAFAVHQSARFCNNPKKVHEQAIKRIVRYLRTTQADFKGRHKTPLGIFFRPDKTKSIDTYVDASFAGEWNTEWSDEPSSVMSRTGYVIFYANCPIIWSSKLQTEIALSTTESEYIALSQSMRDVIPLISLLRELQPILSFECKSPTVHCTIFEDNRGCIDLVTTPKIRPRTKHIALKYHHFRSYVLDRTISIKHVDTKLQIADIFTKALSDAQFIVLRTMLMGEAA